MAQSVAQHVSQCRECSEEVDSIWQNTGTTASFFSEALEQIDCLIANVVGSSMGRWRESGLTPSTATPAPRSTRSIGRYDLEGTVGRGSFGVVHLGVHPVLKNRVAIKVSHVAFESDRQKQFFLAEAETAARLDHGNVVRVLDAGEMLDNRCFIVFEYVKGRNLRNFMAGQRLHLRQALAIFRGIMAGVQHAHQRGVVHRDLKPSNIMLDQDMRPRITDFGLALLMQGSGRWVGTGGTRGYMAPEQVNGELKRIDARTDIFALGILLAEMISGKILKVGVDSPFSLGDFRSTLKTEGVPEELIRISCKCCMPRPKDRYQNIDELAEAIDQLPLQEDASTTRLPLQSVGLRPFHGDEQHLYREWLDVGRLGAQLKSAIKLLKSRIERFGFEPSFSLGLISGPAGGGKTSFLQAGLLPELSSEIHIKWFDCRSDSTAEIEEYLMHSQVGGRGIDGSEKTLIVLDHFATSRFDSFEVLSRALGRLDGTTHQCLLVSDHADLPGTLALFDELEIALDPQDNYLCMPVLESQYAEQVLRHIGTNRRSLPENEEIASRVVRQIVDKIQKDDLLQMPVLALFLERFSFQQWDEAFLKQLDGVVMWQFEFARDQWFKDSSDRLLLPVLTMMLEGGRKIDFSQIADDLGEVRVLTELKQQLNDLSPSLLIRPQGDEESELRATCEFASSYARQILSAYVSNSERLGGRLGNTWYRFHQEAHRWNVSRDPQDLVSFSRLPQNLWVAMHWNLSPVEQRFLRNSLLQGGRRLFYAVTALLLVLVTFWGYQRIENYRMVSEALKGEWLLNEASDSQFFYQPAVAALTAMARDAGETPANRINALGAIAATGAFSADEFIELSASLDTHERAQLLELSERQKPLLGLRHELERHRQQLAGDRRLLCSIHLLFVGNAEGLNSLVAEADDLGKRIALSERIQKLLQPEITFRAAIQEGLTPAARAVLVDCIEFTDVSGLIDQEKCRADFSSLVVIAQDQQHNRLLSSCWRIVLAAGEDLSNAWPDWKDGKSKTAFVNSRQMLMLRTQSPSREPLYVSAAEVGVAQVKEFLEAETSKKFSDGFTYNQTFTDDRVPFMHCTPIFAMEFCNYLSRQEGREPYYVNPRELAGFADSNWEIYQLNENADGYRLMTSQLWRNLEECIPAWKQGKVSREALKWQASLQSYASRPIGVSRPNRYGMFDMVGNAYEVLQRADGEVEFDCAGGMYALQISESDIQPELLGKVRYTAGFLGIHVVCPVQRNQP